MKKIRVTLTISLLTVAMISCNKPSNQQSIESSDPTSSSEISSSVSNSEKEVFKVTFKNYDDSTLYETEVEKGEPAIYEGETPTRPSTDEVEYTFKGWDKDLTAINEEIVTYALYDEKGRGDWGDIVWGE